MSVMRKTFEKEYERQRGLHLVSRSQGWGGVGWGAHVQEPAVILT